MCLSALCAQAVIKRFDECILDRLAWPGEVRAVSREAGHAKKMGLSELP
jgi:hypothetical protein